MRSRVPRLGLCSGQRNLLRKAHQLTDASRPSAGYRPVAKDRALQVELRIGDNQKDALASTASDSSVLETMFRAIPKPTKLPPADRLR